MNSKYKPDDWWHRTFNWELVAGFGRSSLATASIATPFIGYLIIYHSKLDQYLFSNSIETDVFNKFPSCTPLMSGNARLNFLYLGLTLIGIGSIIFRIFSPQIIKISTSISDYIESELLRVTARNLRTMFVTIKSRRKEIIDDFIDRASWLERENCSLKIASDNFRQLKDDQIQIDILRRYYNVSNRYTARPLVYMTALLYLIGFALLAIPSFSSTAHVICTMYYGSA